MRSCEDHFVVHAVVVRKHLTAGVYDLVRLLGDLISRGGPQTGFARGAVWFVFWGQGVGESCESGQDGEEDADLHVGELSCGGGLLVEVSRVVEVG